MLRENHYDVAMSSSLSISLNTYAIYLFLLIDLKYIVVVVCRRLPPRGHEAMLGSGHVIAVPRRYRLV